MRFLVAIVTAVSCACAARVVELQHPSPVNPDVLVAVKPEEKIELITDPKEIIKFKRETKHPFYPTILPKDNGEHSSEHQHISKTQTFESTVVANKNHQMTQSLNKTGSNIRSRRDVETYHNFAKSKHIVPELQKPQTLLSEETKSTNNGDKEAVNKKTQELTAIFSPLQQSKNIHEEDKNKASEEFPKKGHTKISNEERNEHSIISEALEKTQDKPSLLSFNKKRDIPVPLVPKYHHPEESPKESDEKELNEYEKKLHPDHQLPPDHAKIEGFQKVSTLPLILQETASGTEEHKRDIPVPLVPKHQHTVESPKENVDEVSLSDKELYTKNSNAPYTSAHAHGILLS